VSRHIAVVDGANVAYEETGPDGGPRIANLVAMRTALIDAGYDPIIVVDASLRHEIDDPAQLEALLDDNRVRQAPAGTQADRFVLTIADEHDARVVSNDLFEDHRKAHPDVEERRLPFMIVRGDVFLDPAEQGSDG
jgi:hypothetical protein